MTILVALNWGYRETSRINKQPLNVGWWCSFSANTPKGSFFHQKYLSWCIFTQSQSHLGTCWKVFFRWLFRKHCNKQRVCWIRPSNEAISYTELLRANKPHRINQFGQSSKLASVTPKQATAYGARNRTNQKVFESCGWCCDGAAVRADANRLHMLLFD